MVSRRRRYSKSEPGLRFRHVADTTHNTCTYMRTNGLFYCYDFPANRRSLGALPTRRNNYNYKVLLLLT